MITLNFYRRIVWAVLSIYLLSLAGCTTTKLIKPDQRPKRIKSDKIWVVTETGQSLFSEIKMQNDTLFGVVGTPFPKDLRSPEVTAIPYSEIKSIEYKGTHWGNTIGIIVGVAAIAALIVAIATCDFLDFELYK